MLNEISMNDEDTSGAGKPSDGSAGEHTSDDRARNRLIDEKKAFLDFFAVTYERITVVQVSPPTPSRNGLPSIEMS
jgi:hypothetical protein